MEGAGDRPFPAQILKAAVTANSNCMSFDSALTSHALLPTAAKIATKEARVEGEMGVELGEDHPMLDEESGCTSDESVAEVLWVSGTGEQHDCDGVYRLVDAETANGFPLWKRESGTRWLYSSLGGKWHFGTTHERKKQFNCSSGWMAPPWGSQRREPCKAK